MIRWWFTITIRITTALVLLIGITASVAQIRLSGTHYLLGQTQNLTYRLIETSTGLDTPFAPVSPGLIWSPGKDYVALLQGARRIAVYETASGQRVWWGGSLGISSGIAVWSADGHYLVFEIIVDVPTNRLQIYRLDLHTLEVQPIGIERLYGLNTSSSSSLSLDGRWILLNHLGILTVLDVDSQRSIAISSIVAPVYFAWLDSNNLIVSVLDQSRGDINYLLVPVDCFPVPHTCKDRLRLIAVGDLGFTFSVFGNELFYISDQHLQQLSINGGIIRPLYQSTISLLPHISPDGNEVLVFSEQPDQALVPVTINLKTGRTRQYGFTNESITVFVEWISLEESLRIKPLLDQLAQNKS